MGLSFFFWNSRRVWVFSDAYCGVQSVDVLYRTRDKARRTNLQLLVDWFTARTIWCFADSVDAFLSFSKKRMGFLGGGRY